MGGSRQRTLFVGLLALAACSPAPSAKPLSSPTVFPTVAASPAAVATKPPPSVLPSDGSAWIAAGRLLTARGNHTATLLADGRVLVAGGQTVRHGAGVASAELYDPQTHIWTSAGTMSSVRWAHAAARLPNGDVLVTGGLDANDQPLATAELFHPADGTWQAVANMSTTRAAHTSTLLRTGKVLVAGGGPGPAELYDPKAHTWSPTGGLPLVLDSATATMLDDGKVLLAGGFGYSPDGVVASTEVYDPVLGTWTPGANLTAVRQYHAAALLVDGKVLVTGGFDPARGALSYADLSDFGTDNSFGSVGSMLEARLGHTATTLPNGLVLVVGGQKGPSLESISSAELYDSGAYGSDRPEWQSTESVPEARDGHTATLLDSGDVLVIGGFGGTGAVAQAEEYRPAPRPLPEDGRADEGTYRPHFEPALSITLWARGAVEVNRRGWMGIAFGFDPPAAHAGGSWGAEINVIRLDEVFVPGSTSALMPVPADLATWIATRPGTRVIAGPKRITIGGRSATQMDIAVSAVTPWGPIPESTETPAGIGPGAGVRVFVSDGPRPVLIVLGLIDTQDPALLQRAIDAMQPMVESITWP
jgi:hypothetical protein